MTTYESLLAKFLTLAEFYDCSEEEFMNWLENTNFDSLYDDQDDNRQRYREYLAQISEITQDDIESVRYVFEYLFEGTRNSKMRMAMKMVEELVTKWISRQWKNFTTRFRTRQHIQKTS